VRNVNPDELGPARGFAHATVAGDTVWIGGQIGSDETGAVVEPGDLVAQFARAIRNVATALGAAGCGPEDTVKLTYYVTAVDAYRNNLRAIGDAYRASVLVEVSSLFDPQALIEIDAVAVRRP
jgi:enamine deaminase RidA (YjgF/YER057c/UK114 family)